MNVHRGAWPDVLLCGLTRLNDLAEPRLPVEAVRLSNGATVATQTLPGGGGPRLLILRGGEADAAFAQLVPADGPPAEPTLLRLGRRLATPGARVGGRLRPGHVYTHFAPAGIQVQVYLGWGQLVHTECGGADAQAASTHLCVPLGTLRQVLGGAVLDCPHVDVHPAAVRRARADVDLADHGPLLGEDWLAAHRVLVNRGGVVNLGPPMDRATLLATWRLASTAVG